MAAGYASRLRSAARDRPAFATVGRLRYWLLLGVAVLLAGLTAACNSDSAGARQRFTPGLVSTANHRLSAAAAGKLGADVVRVEFDIGTPTRSMRETVAAIARRGARPLLLAGFHGRIPTEAEARNLGSWAAAFGPGGSFWAKPRATGCRSG